MNDRSSSGRKVTAYTGSHKEFRGAQVVSQRERPDGKFDVLLLGGNLLLAVRPESLTTEWVPWSPEIAEMIEEGGTMTTFFTSDLHFGHQRVAEWRGFDGLAEHDDHLAQQWRSVVKDGDEVWVLGDVALGGWANTVKIFDALPGTKHLVLGNHDRAHPINRNAHKHIATLALFFETVQTAASVRAGGYDLMLSHFPYDGDHTDEERYDEWRLRDCGRPLVHGHVHSTERFTRSATGTPQVHVGVDAWNWGPVPLRDVLVQLDSMKN